MIATDLHIDATCVVYLVVGTCAGGARHLPWKQEEPKCYGSQAPGFLGLRGGVESLSQSAVFSCHILPLWPWLQALFAGAALW